MICAVVAGPAAGGRAPIRERRVARALGRVAPAAAADLTPRSGRGASGRGTGPRVSLLGSSQDPALRSAAAELLSPVIGTGAARHDPRSPRLALALANRASAQASPAHQHGRHSSAAGVSRVVTDTGAGAWKAAALCASARRLRRRCLAWIGTVRPSLPLSTNPGTARRPIEGRRAPAPRPVRQRAALRRRRPLDRAKRQSSDDLIASNADDNGRQGGARAASAGCSVVAHRESRQTVG